MRIAQKVWGGLALILIGIASFVGRHVWDKTWIPVDQPLTVPARDVSTVGFLVDHDADYLVSITAEKTIPLNTLDCLLGIDAIFDNCQSTRSAVNAAWLLSADGKEVAHGSSDTERVAGWSDRVFRGIGRFAAKRGQRYTLNVNFFSDTAPLKPTKPHLRIAALPPMNYNEFGFSLLYSLWKFAEAACVFIGLILMAFQLLKRDSKSQAA